MSEEFPKVYSRVGAEAYERANFFPHQKKNRIEPQLISSWFAFNDLPLFFVVAVAIDRVEVGEWI